MKKFLYLASGAALALASCSDDLGLKNPQTEVDGQYTIVASWGDKDATRTSVEYNGNAGFKYSWSDTDVIGLFNESPNDQTNAQFKYAGSNNEFKGSYQVLAENNYYGYYPWSRGTKVENSTLVALEIMGLQNFNFEAAAIPSEGAGIPNGSFSPGEAPAVAWGQLSANNEVMLQFSPVAAYMVVPLTGYKTINQVNIQVQDGDGYFYPMNGFLNINMAEGEVIGNPGVVDANGEELEKVAKADLEGLSSEKAGYYTTTLNLGKGYELNINEPTYLWFVVPANLPYAGTTVTLGIFDTDEGSSTVSTSINNPSPEMGCNKTRGVAADKNGKPFFYNPDGLTILPDQFAFLEYAYIATNADAVSQYNSLNATNKSYFNQNNYLDGEGNLLPAYVLDDITFNYQEVAAKFEGASSGLTDQAYYQGIYGSFIKNQGVIPTIGGAKAFSINGSFNPNDDEETETNSLIGLKVNGNSLFQSSGSASGTYPNLSKGVSVISNIVFDNVEVNAATKDNQQPEEGTYYFLSSSYVRYSNVTVNNTCSLLPAPEDTQVALFNVLNTNNLGLEVPMYDVTNESGMLFAYSLEVNSNHPYYNYKNDDLPVYSQFGSIDINVVGSLLTVADQADAVTVLSLLSDNSQPYSMMNNYEDCEEPLTSYWSGTNYGATSTYYTISQGYYPAELLAFVVQNNSGYSKDLTNDINLMGTYSTTEGEQHMYWWNNGGDNAISVSVPAKKNYTISNVWIDGTKDGKKPASNYYTLFGRTSKVTNLTVDNITINNVANDNYPEGNANAVMAAIAYTPGATSSVYVSDMTVNNDVEDLYFGGLYYQLWYTNLPWVEDNTIEFASIPEGNYGAIAGKLVGNIQANATPVTLVNSSDISVSDYNLFGDVQFEILNPQNIKSVNIIVLEGFPLNIIGTDNLYQMSKLAQANGGTVYVTTGEEANVFTWNYNSETAPYCYKVDPITPGNIPTTYSLK